jgi:eukaryotic-like serine/threonine-protein kinase
MSSDYTFQQTPADQQRSKDLSLQRTRPPAEVPGYQTQRFLGSGAYGEVWVGLDCNTGRKVAIKYYLHRRGVDWSLLSREVEKLRFLSADRYVVQLLDVGWDAEPPYYVMEYIEHGSLDDRLRRHGTFAVPEAVELFQEIAVGLAHAHGKGVVHCDLKPANILIDQDGKPRLADFGQSPLSHEQKPALGTLFYMAPEQADLQAVPDVRWDVYALGAIFYTLLVGIPPHRNDDTVGKIDAAGELEDRLAHYRHSIRSAPLPSEHRRIRGVDRALAEIIDRCLAVNPDDRFVNVQEVIGALEARQRNRSRLPLMVLGFLGPLLALLITAFFSYRGYARAVENAEVGYGTWALENNQFAAQLAAEKVTGQITRYFELANTEAADPTFSSLFFAVVKESPTLKKLVDRETPAAEIASIRTAFHSEAQRSALERYLEERMRHYQALAQRDSRVLRFASMFVTDRHGTQLASVFDDRSISLSIGKNWAHRTYFHGGPQELEPLERPPQNPQHIQRTHLSAAFFSSSQKTWKVAISAPIYRLSGDVLEFEGILVLTVDLADFNVSASTMRPDHDQFLVLVDGRSGPEKGTVLHHPLFKELADREKKVPEEFFRREYRVPEEVIHGQGDTNYRDPLSRWTDPDRLAQAYDRRWLAAAAPVLPPIGATSDSSDSGLVVLVQSDYQSVVRPARQLGNQFIRNSFWMFVVMFTVSLSLWYIAVRMFREPRAGLNRPATPVPESAPAHDMTTIAATTRPHG